MKKEDIADAAIKYFSRWLPEINFPVNSPAFEESRNLRHMVLKYKRQLAKDKQT